LDKILPLVPPHQRYIEPFAGGLAVLLALTRCRAEVINDANRDVVNFYRCVRFHLDALLAELGGVTRLNSRADFADWLANPGLTDLQRAAHWFLLRVCSFGGKSESWGRCSRNYHGWDAARHGELITRLSERLQRVYIECGDWEEVVCNWDSPVAFTFFDPPYVAAARTAYAPFSPEEMARVRARLDKMKGTYLLTCDDSPQCREIFAGLPARQIPVRYSLGSRLGPAREVNELLVMHPRLAPPDAQILTFPIPFRAAKSARRRAAQLVLHPRFTPS
jgi:DNA adenine methylase